MDSEILEILVDLFGPEATLGSVAKSTVDGQSGWWYRPFDGGCHFMAESLASFKKQYQIVRQERLEAALGLPVHR